MNKKILFLFATVITCAVAGYFIVSRMLQPTTTTKPTPMPQSAPSSTSQILVPTEIFTGVVINQQSNLIDPSTQTRVTFHELNDELHKGRSPSYEVFVNQDRVGEASGYLMMPSFSPGGKFLAFRSMWVLGCAGTCFDSAMYVVNTVDRTIVKVAPPRKKTDYSGSVKIPEGEVNNAIVEPYRWDGATSIEVYFYYVGFSARDNKYYRVTSREIWRYDLTTKQYMLIETLPE